MTKCAMWNGGSVIFHDVPDECDEVHVPVFVYEEPTPIVRTAETFFVPPKGHWERDVYRRGAAEDAQPNEFFFVERVR